MTDGELKIELIMVRVIVRVMLGVLVVVGVPVVLVEDVGGRTG